MLNDLFDFEQPLSVDEVEDELREARNVDFMEGKAVHVFTEITAILDYMPAGWESEEEEEGVRPAAKEDQLDDADLPALDEAEEERLKNDQSLKWDEDEEEPDGDETEEESRARGSAEAGGEDKEDKEEKGDEEKPDDELDEENPPRRRSTRGRS